MEQRDKEKIEGILADRKEAHKYFYEKSPVYRAFMEMEKETFKDGAISRMNKELIAIAISIISNCEPCLEWHIKKAKETGATEEQIVEAIEVAFEMGIGPTTASSRFALKAMGYYS